MRIRYHGREAFTVKQPPTERQVRSGNPEKIYFRVVEEVGVHLRQVFREPTRFDPDTDKPLNGELKWVNRYKDHKGVTRSEFRNIELPVMEFTPGEVTEVDDEIGEALTSHNSRFFTVAVDTPTTKPRKGNKPPPPPPPPADPPADPPAHPPAPGEIPSGDNFK